MTTLRGWLSLLILASLPLAASAQAKKRLEHIVIFKDGFYIKGKVSEKVGEVIYDSKSGQGFPILAGEFFIDDNVRTIYFGHSQIQKVIPLESKVPMQIVRLQIDLPAERHPEPVRVRKLLEMGRQGGRARSRCSTPARRWAASRCCKKSGC